MFSCNISIIIPIYNRTDVFRTVSCLQEQEYFSHLWIIIIDNGNPEELSARLKSLESEHCHILSLPENRGGSGAFIAGVNFAMKEYPENQYIWLLDDDAEINGDTLPALVEEMIKIQKSGIKIAGMGSTILQKQNPDIIIESGAKYVFRKRYVIPNFRGENINKIEKITIPVQYCAATSLLVAKEAIEKGGFWEDVFIHFDDIEWCYRLQAKGYRFYATLKSTVIHFTFSCWKSKFWIRYYDLRNSYWFAASQKSKFLIHWLFKDWRSLQYLRLHGDHTGVQLYTLARQDFRSGKVRLRHELPKTEFTPIDWDSVKNSKKRIIACVLYPEAIEFIQEKLGDIPFSQILYYRKPKKHLLLYPAFAAIIQCFYQIRSFFSQDCEILLFDGGFRMKKMLPYLHRNKFFADFSHLYNQKWDIPD